MSSATQEAIVYGPIKSRKQGATLGVNLMPSDRDQWGPSCIYRKLPSEETNGGGSRFNRAPSPGVIVTAAARRIIELSKGGEKVRNILVTGDEEPTMHPGFLEITENLRDLRDKWFPKAKLHLSTMPFVLDTAQAKRAVTIYDRPTAIFEWGTVKTFSALTGEATTRLKEYQEVLAQFDKLVLEATFVKGAVDNSTESEVRGWVKRVKEIEPREVQIRTLDAPTGEKSRRFRGVPPARLEKIAAELTDKTEIAVTILTEDSVTRAREK